MNWEEIYSGIRSFAGRAATKINQTADMATLQVKLSMAEHKLEEAYAALGKASFGHFVEDKENFDQISACINDVKNAKLEIRSINTQIQELRDRVVNAVAEAENFQDTVADAAAEAANAVKVAKAAKEDADARAAAIRAKQEEEAEPLEVFDFDDDDFIVTDSSIDIEEVEIELDIEE